MGDYDREAVLVAKLLGVEEIPALTRQRLLHDPVLYNLMKLAVVLYEENQRLKHREEPRGLDGHGPGYD